MFRVNDRTRRNIRRQRTRELLGRVSNLPPEIQEMVLQEYLQGLHARLYDDRIGRLTLRSRRISRGAVNYARHRVRQLRSSRRVRPATFTR